MMRRSYLKIKYLDGTKQHLPSFLSFSQRMCELCFTKFHIKSFTSFIHKKFIIIFEIHMPTGALQCFSIAVRHIDLLLKISRNFFSRGSRTQSNIWQSVGFLWAIDQTNSKISVWLLTSLKVDRFLNPRRESNP